MSSSLCWKPVLSQSGDLSCEVKSALVKWKEGYWSGSIVVGESEIGFISGLVAGGVH